MPCNRMPAAGQASLPPQCARPRAQRQPQSTQRSISIALCHVGSSLRFVGRICNRIVAPMRLAEMIVWLSRVTGCVTLALAVVSCSRQVSVEQVLAVYHRETAYPATGFRQPLDGTVLPPDLAPLTFTWEQPAVPPQSWVILVEFSDGARPNSFVSGRPEWTPAPEDWDPEQQPADAHLGPDELLHAAQRERNLHQALAELPPEQAQVLRLSYFDEQPHRRIAEDLGIPLGTVKSRIRLAVTQLRRLLERTRT